jgi:hypothetical protein
MRMLMAGIGALGETIAARAIHTGLPVRLTLGRLRASADKTASRISLIS